MNGTCYDQQTGANWALYHGDSVLALPGLPNNSVGLTLTSVPFSDQYSYSPSLHDFGNTDGDRSFFKQMAYLIPEVLRVTIPGRFAIVHCKDRIVYGSRNNGYRKTNRFSDKCADAYEAHGFDFIARITIETDPVRENAQTNNLPYSELKKDASRFGCGMPEYLLLFRKPHTQTAEGGQWSDVRIDYLSDENYGLPRWQLDANSFWRSSGQRLPYEADGYDYHAHVAHLENLDRRMLLGRAHGQPVVAHSDVCWWDIQRIKVLNDQLAKESEDEKHICPLQLDLIERCITRWSNPGDIVLDYFSGIGSVAHEAVRMGRKGVGIELKRSYHLSATKFLTKLELSQQQLAMDLAG